MAYTNEIVLRDECRDLFNSHIVGLKEDSAQRLRDKCASPRVLFLELAGFY